MPIMMITGDGNMVCEQSLSLRGYDMRMIQTVGHGTCTIIDTYSMISAASSNQPTDEREREDDLEEENGKGAAREWR